MKVNLSNRPSDRAFSLPELLVSLSVIALLASLLLPAIGRARAQARSTGCLNNLHQLQLTWLIYAHDNDDSIPPNIARKQGLNMVNARVGERVPWVLGNTKLDGSSSNLEAGVFGKYLKNTQVYRCPADRSGLQDEPATPRTRSYSSHEFLNCDAISNTPLDSVTDSEWNIRKVSRLPDPGQTWVYIDEHEASIDDGIFVISSPWSADKDIDPDFWSSFPADRHNNGINLTFADGHCEHHRWLGHRQIDAYINMKIYIRIDDRSNLADLHWLQERIPHSP